jgi:hypothetical protein
MFQMKQNCLTAGSGGRCLTWWKTGLASEAVPGPRIGGVAEDRLSPFAGGAGCSQGGV